MPRVRTPETSVMVETKREPPAASRRRLAALERLVEAIEAELDDDELTDEQKLQNIGERVAGFTDGR